jgi:uncharacterized alkaline shock family protein YloU
MTKFLHTLSGLLILFLSAAIGLALLHANIPGVERTAFDFIPLHSRSAAGIGAEMILLILLYLITFGPRRLKVRYISFESEAGGVAISVNAVRDYISKISGEFSAVVSIDPKIWAEKDKINIDLNVNLVAGARIPELSQALKARVRESLREGLGIEDINDIGVSVQKITGEPRSTRRGD